MASVANVLSGGYGRGPCDVSLNRILRTAEPAQDIHISMSSSEKKRASSHTCPYGLRGAYEATKIISTDSPSEILTRNLNPGPAGKRLILILLFINFWLSTCWISSKPEPKNKTKNKKPKNQKK